MFPILLLNNINLFTLLSIFINVIILILYNVLQAIVNRRDFGPPDQTYSKCGALMRSQEGHKSRTVDSEYIFNRCSKHGKIILPLLQHPPPYLRSLMEDFNSNDSTKFKKSIRSYNNAFSSTLLGANIDYCILNGGGPFTFRIHDKTYHKIGSLLPVDGKQPKFAQLYIYDTEHKLKNRKTMVTHGVQETNLDNAIIEGLKAVLDDFNPSVKYCEVLSTNKG